MKAHLKLGELEIFWLQGGEFSMDGGAMFGVVPKILWSQKCLSDSDNSIKLVSMVLLVKTRENNVLIESGIGNKLTEKQKKIFKVTKNPELVDDLKKCGLEPSDIDHVILTHCDFDHAGGIVTRDKFGKDSLTLPKAKHVIQNLEWEDVLNPNVRSINTYWSQNFKSLTKDNILLVDGEKEIVPGVRVGLTGGHTRGHQAVFLESCGESAIHLGDLFPTHHHLNPLWIMAYDNFPLDAIKAKEKYIETYRKQKSWFTFYHDPEMLACKFDENGNITDTIERT